MGSEAKWIEGEPREFVDPRTGEVITEVPLVMEAKPKRSLTVGMGFVLLNMDALAVAGRYLGKAGLLVLMEAARQWRLGNGSVSLTSAFCGRFCLSRQAIRTASRELSALASETGWVSVRRAGNRAVEVSITKEGFSRIWHK